MSTPTTNYGFIKAAEGEQYDLDITNNNLDSLDAILKTLDKSAKGVIYKNGVIGNTGTIIDAIADSIPSFTFKANRNYQIVWDTSYYATGNSDSLFYFSVGTAAVADVASALTNISVIEGRTRAANWYSLQGTHHYDPIVVDYNPGPSDVVTQLKFRIQRVTGDDGIILVGNANEKRYYRIIDLGANW